MRKRGKLYMGTISLLAIFGMIAGITVLWTRAEKGESEMKDSIRLGVSVYRWEDAFVTTLRTELEEQVKEYERQTGKKVILDIMDAKENQSIQNSQVDRFISLGCDALCINMVDRSAASNIVDKAMAADVPVVFFNREPVEEDMDRWDKLYYVGADAKESAVIQGTILADAYDENPGSLDLNGDGVVKYVLLEGESNHQDSLVRTEWSIQTLKDRQVPIEKVTGGIANWDRSQASAFMEQWLKQYPDEIELVISNNDEMALGAIEAMERSGVMKDIKVVGIDATPAALEAVEEGKLMGTVNQDIESYAGTIFDIARCLAYGDSVEETVELEGGKYYRSPQKAVTAKDF